MFTCNIHHKWGHELFNFCPRKTQPLIVDIISFWIFEGSSWVEFIEDADDGTWWDADSSNKQIKITLTSEKYNIAHHNLGVSSYTNNLEL